MSLGERAGPGSGSERAVRGYTNPRLSATLCRLKDLPLYYRDVVPLLGDT